MNSFKFLLYLISSRCQVYGIFSAFEQIDGNSSKEKGETQDVGCNWVWNEDPKTFNFCYKSIVLITPKIFTIVKETFTPIPKKFMISVTGWYLGDWQEIPTFDLHQIWFWWYDITTFFWTEIISMYLKFALNELWSSLTG